jgi:uncharacterized Fe-S cluster-containing protein
MPKEIKYIMYPKQCKAYYKALEDGDGYAANLLHLPPVTKPLYMIESEMRFQEIVDNYEAEAKRIEETPNEMLRLELEIKYGDKHYTKPTSLLERVFGKR